MRNWILYIFGALCLISCGSTTPAPEVSSPTDYHPIEVGKFWVYQVDSILYDNLGEEVINTSGFVREELTSVLSEEELSTIYVLDRFFRKSQADEWKITDRWTLTKGRNNIIRTEENLRFIKMMTPLTTGTSWEGNQFDTDIILTVLDESIMVYKNWSYQILETGAVENIGGVDYNDLLVIQQADDENLIERRNSIEKYARDIGLVYRYMEIFDTQCIEECEGQTWFEKAERGYSLTQTLIDHN